MGWKNNVVGMINMMSWVVRFLYSAGFVPLKSYLWFCIVQGGANYTVAANQMNRGLGEFFGDIAVMTIILIIIPSPSLRQKFIYSIAISKFSMTAMSLTCVTGVVLPLLLLNMLENPRTAAEEEDTPNYGLFSREFNDPHGWHLVGVNITSFLRGINDFSSILFQNLMFESAVLYPPAQPEILVYFAIVVIYVVGFLCRRRVFFIHRGHRFPIQSYFIAAKAVLTLFAAMDTSWNKKDNLIGLCFLYAFDRIIMSSANVTTCVVTFPRRRRATCHALSSAAFKLGQTLAVLLFSYGGHHNFRLIFFLLSLINVVGTPATFLLPPDSNGEP
ncbi:hypothetical protein PIB30_046985 [Stylosanthes scabra]|uniref:Uncharacterized protein n=1 Tax=Stylosanthes scabra TaxID=79078 RepID=A0ABU6VJI1_9FABA|nr:hypothetical protein [Stylosanthes scabra]